MGLKIDIRDKRLRGSRITLDAQTEDAGVRDHREAVLRDMVEQDESLLIEGLRRRRLDIDEVAAVWGLGKAARTHELQRLRQRLAGGTYTGPVLGECIDQLLAKVSANQAAGTHEFYTIVAASIRASFGERRLLADILTRDVERFLVAPKTSNGGRPWGPSRQRAACAFGGRLWREAIRDEEERSEREGRSPLVRINVWRRADVTRERTARAEYLRPAEWQALRSVVAGRPAAALLAIGCRAGLRAEEAAYLRTGIDVDLGQRVIHVRSRRGEWPWRPKRKRGERDVPMPDDLLEILTEHARYFAGRTFFIAPPDDRERPIGHTTIIRWTRDAFRTAGIRYGRKKDALTFHSLRHTYASWLTQAGMHPKKVARLIGDSPEMVLQVYGHLAEDDHGEAVALLNAAVSSTS